MPEQTTYEQNRDAGREITRLGGGEAVGMVMGIMAHNAESRANLEQDLLRGMEADRDYWKDRAEIAEAEVDLLWGRFKRLFMVTDAEIDTYLGKEKR